MDKKSHLVGAADYFAAMQSPEFPAPADALDQQIIDATVSYILVGVHSSVLQLEVIDSSHRRQIVSNTIAYVRGSLLSIDIDPAIDERIEGLQALIMPLEQE